MATELWRNDECGVDLRGEPENIRRAIAKLNAHAGLVAACRRMRQFIADHALYADGDRGRDVVEEADAALAATEAAP